MDFLGVSDAGDWGDWGDSKDLHTQLFSSSKAPRKKSKATGKRQGTSDAKRETSQDIEHRLKRISPRQLKNDQHPRSIDAGAGLETGQNETLQKKTTTKKKKKRKRETSDEGRARVMKKPKVHLVSAAPAKAEIPDAALPGLRHNGEVLESERTRKQSPTKKRKRKPRNNKFKTTEFGYTLPQSEPVKANAGGEGSRSASAKSTKDQANRHNQTGVAKRTKGADGDADSAAEGKRHRTKRRNGRNRRKKKETRVAGDSLQSSSGSGQQPTIPELVDKRGAAKASETKPMTSTEVGSSAQMKTKESGRAGKVSQRSDERSTAIASVAENDKTELVGPAEGLDGGDSGTVSDSEEPRPDPAVRQALKSKMEARLKAAHFRYLNEQLYRTTGSQARQMMAGDREMFDIYHQGFSQQVRQWPANPVDQFIEDLKSRSAALIVGDFGCGEARIAQSVSQTVHSFDLCALNEHVKACDMEKVPLKGKSLDVAIFCLSLMGTNWIAYIKEANRVLKMGGQLMIAEVASRFTTVADFLKIMKQLGFKRDAKDFSNKMFLRFDFTKEAVARKVEVERGKVLRPCLYKRR